MLSASGLNRAGETHGGALRPAWPAIAAAVPWESPCCALADPQRRLINLRLFVSLRGCGAITTATRKVQSRAVPWAKWHAVEPDL